MTSLSMERKTQPTNPKWSFIDVQWNPSCEATSFAPEMWPFKRGGLSSGIKFNIFCLNLLCLVASLKHTFMCNITDKKTLQSISYFGDFQLAYFHHFPTNLMHFGS